MDVTGSCPRPARSLPLEGEVRWGWATRSESIAKSPYLSSPPEPVLISHHLFPCSGVAQSDLGTGGWAMWRIALH